MSISKKLCLIGAAIFGCVTMTSAAANDYSSHEQSLNSSDGLFRVHFMELDTFEVMQSGDPNSAGELTEVVVSIQFGNRHHSYTVPVSSLYNQSTGQAGNSAYVKVVPGNLVTFEQRRTRQPANLWLDVKHNGASFPTSLSTTTVRLNIKTRELDCTRQRRCKRGNTGSWTLSVELPDYDATPMFGCGASNTYDLARLDNEVRLIGYEPTSVYSYGRTNRARQGSVIQRSREGAILRPTRGKVCIESVSPSYENSVLFRNVTTNRCLTVPRTRRDGAVANINTCTFDVSPAAASPQKWLLDSKGASRYAIRNAGINLCLNLRKSQDDREGGPAKLVRCSDHSDQLWEKHPVAGGNFQLRNVGSGKCLNVHGGLENRDWGNVSVYSCADSPDQFWQEVAA